MDELLSSSSQELPQLGNESFESAASTVSQLTDEEHMVNCLPLPHPSISKETVRFLKFAPLSLGIDLLTVIFLNKILNHSG